MKKGYFDVLCKPEEGVIEGQFGFLGFQIKIFRTRGLSRDETILFWEEIAVIWIFQVFEQSIMSTKDHQSGRMRAPAFIMHIL